MKKVPSNTLKIRVAAPQTYLIRCRKPWGATTLPKVTLAATVRLLTDYANLVVSQSEHMVRTHRTRAHLADLIVLDACNHTKLEGWRAGRVLYASYQTCCD